MNGVFASLGIEAWKPVLTALAMPPVPLLLLVLIGARLMFWRRSAGWLVIVTAVAGLWLGSSVGAGEWLARAMLHPPPALSAARLADLRRDAAAKRPVAIVVLGAGRESLAPEYGISNLGAASLERLRYGVWLGRETGLPVGFSGGTGQAQDNGPSEAEIAGRIAAREFGRPLRWMENASRDTRENAIRTLALLKAEGITDIVLVTHGWHMPRSRRAFERAALRAEVDLKIVAAPMALAPRIESPALRWLPSAEGFALVRSVLREAAGLLAGA